MSRFTTITAAGANINDLSVDNIRGLSASSQFNISSDINLNNRTIRNAKILNLNNAVDFIYDTNRNTAAIRLTGTTFKGIIYDTNFNKPYEQILPITKEYILPDNNGELLRAIPLQPTKIYILNPFSGNQVFDMPSLPSTPEYQNTHIRFSNNNINYLINFTYKGQNIIQIGYERASFIWYTDDGTNYYWKYVT